MPKLTLDPNEPVDSSPIDGYRPCTAVIVTSGTGLTLLGQRTGDYELPWQYPQGGIDKGETPFDACLRELVEETGIGPDDFGSIFHMPLWVKYELPKGTDPSAVGKIGAGQVQAWFLLQTTLSDDDPSGMLDYAIDDEFVSLKWAKPSEAIDSVVPFKRAAYRKAISHFAGKVMRGNKNWRGIR